MVIVALSHVPQCFSRDDGVVINKVIRAAIAQDGRATISFAGVSDVPSSFVNAALVGLLDTYSFDWIKQHITITHATRQTTDMIRRCFASPQQLVAA